MVTTRDLPGGSTEHILYDGQIRMVFNPNSPRYRYTVSDGSTGVREQSTRGVTTVIGDVLDKPGLRTWPMNMANSVLFGTTFDETLKDYRHDWKAALIKPGVSYTEEELHEAFKAGSREWTKRSDKGKDIGTLTHRSVELYLLDAPEPFQMALQEADPDMPKDYVVAAQKALKSFTEWWESLEQAQVIETERPIYSRSLNYAGTFDLLAKINGKTYMLDVKTTNAGKEAPLGIYPEMFIQLGAYSYAMREETGIEIDDCGILRLGKDGKLHIATASDIGVSRDECERAFAFAVRLHDWLSTISPFLKDVHFKSPLLQSAPVDGLDSVTNKEATNV
jgi:hypothetical protein